MMNKETSATTFKMAEDKELLEDVTRNSTKETVDTTKDKAAEENAAIEMDNSKDESGKTKEADNLKGIPNDTGGMNLAGQKRKACTDSESMMEKKKQKLNTKAKLHETLVSLQLPEHIMKELDYPMQDPSGRLGRVKLYGSHFGFKEGHCKRCDKKFDTSYYSRSQCDFHTERSKRYSGRQQPHGCCGRSYGSRGCRTAPSHVHQGNLYLELENYRKTDKNNNPDDDKFTIYAVDTESIHTKKGLEVCRVTVVDFKLNVVYNEFCLPTTEVVDYNTIWSGISEKDMEGVTKTFEELREDMLKLFSADTILVGHGMSSDLIAMKIIHERVIDTLYVYPHHRGWPLKRSLKDIALSELGMRIQGGDGHDSAEDAIAAMKLVRKKVLPMIKKLKK